MLRELDQLAPRRLEGADGGRFPFWSRDGRWLGFISDEGVEAMSLIGDVRGKNVLLVDDLTETAGTLTAAARLLMENGAKAIYAGVTHGVLGDKGRERIANSPIVELFATNSTPQAHGTKVTTLDIAPLLSEAIKRIHGDESVTSLFDIRS